MYANRARSIPTSTSGLLCKRIDASRCSFHSGHFCSLRLRCFKVTPSCDLHTLIHVQLITGSLTVDKLSWATSAVAFFKIYVHAKCKCCHHGSIIRRGHWTGNMSSRLFYRWPIEVLQKKFPIQKYRPLKVLIMRLLPIT